MKLRFWGVRGSIAAPGADTKHFGGNTSCVELIEGSERILFDAGTGIRALGKHLLASRCPKNIHLCLSHFHIDHLCGLPFFAPLYHRGKVLHLYGPKGFRRNLRQILAAFFSEEFFPVPMNKIPAKFRFHPLGGQSVRIGPLTMTSFYINHPGRALGYVVASKQHRIAYLSDHEPVRQFHHLKKWTPGSYEKFLLKQLKGIDVLIHDAQFYDHEYPNYRGWGHSPWSYPLAIAQQVGARHLVLFHHAPEHSDQQLQKWLKKSRQRAHRQGHKSRIHLAREGTTILL